MGVRAIASREGLTQANDLVPRARAGDFTAFEALYHRDVERVYALCLRMTADPARAEELTQATFLRAWEKLDSFRGESEFGAWLRKVAINVVLADRRARGRRQEHAMGDLAEFRHPAQAAVPGARLDLERAIAKLPAGARDVFILHDIEGYRHEEIARVLEVAPGTSKAQLHRARKLLREALRS